MLADDLLAQIFHANLQVPPASGAFLHKVRASRHDGISCYRRIPPRSVQWRFSISVSVGRFNHFGLKRRTKHIEGRPKLLLAGDLGRPPPGRVFFVPEKQAFSGASNRPSVQPMQLLVPASFTTSKTAAAASGFALRCWQFCLRVLLAAVSTALTASRSRRKAPPISDVVDASGRIVFRLAAGLSSRRSDQPVADRGRARKASQAAGWKVPNAEQIVELGLADNSFLVRELSTPAGRKFMRKIASAAGRLLAARSAEHDLARPDRSCAI